MTMRTKSVRIADLKAHLSAYLRRVGKGERLVVLDRDRPVAEILPIAETATDLFVRLAREGRCRLGTQRRSKLKITALKTGVRLEDFVRDDLPDVDLPRR